MYYQNIVVPVEVLVEVLGFNTLSFRLLHVIESYRYDGPLLLLLPQNEFVSSLVFWAKEYMLRDRK